MAWQSSILFNDRQGATEWECNSFVETVCTCQTQTESHILGAQGEKKKATQILKSHD